VETIRRVEIVREVAVEVPIEVERIVYQEV